MASINFRRQISNASNTDATSYATSSWTPTNGRVAWGISLGRIAAGTPVEPTASGNGLTWTVRETIALGAVRLTLFSAPVASSSAGGTTFDYGETLICHVGQVYEVTEQNTTTPFVQGDTASDDASTTLTATLGNALSSEWNAVLAIFGVSISTSLTVSTANMALGWAGDPSAAASDGATLQVLLRPDNATAATQTYGSADGVGIIAELNHEGVASGGAPRPASALIGRPGVVG